MGTFEWDEDKDRANIQKHGVPLAAGIPVFEDVFRLEYLDTRHDYGEERYITIGFNGMSHILYVCYTLRGQGTTRLISVRAATRQERRYYEQEAGR